MKIKRILTALLAGPLMWAFAAQAATTTFRGVSVDYGGASTNWVDGELVLKYTGSSQLEIMDGAVMADILAVGGGGAGGTGKSQTSSARYGNGGDGGEVVEKTGVILSDSMIIKIGAGGTGSTTSNASGGDGNDTTVECEDGSFVAITAKGGAGGAGNNTSTQAKAGSPTQGVTSEIDGKTYGKGGAKYTNANAQSGDANTGNGGQGGRANSNATSRKGGNGGSGIVVVRLTDAYAALEDLDIRIGGTVSEFRDSSGNPVSFAYSDVTCRSSVDLVASVVETADGKVGVVGHMAGQTQITIVTGDKTYLLVVTVNPLITGKIRVGAYEVDVQNASKTNWVDGDLVITYLDTTAAEKSFTLPQATTGRLLAVGGGGAGGQEPGVRNDTCGLPGGGGAGGLVANDSQPFAAATYAVVVGAGGVAPRTKPSEATAGADGAASTVTGGGETLANALGGGGGGARSAGRAGGSGGGGSYSGGSKNGGAKQQPSPGFGSAGGKGEHKFFGAGGGGAGGPGGGTGSYSAFYISSKFTDPTSADVYLSGAGGQGKDCDITGENLEYARGGAGGVPRLYAYYYYKGGQINYTNTKPTDQQKKAFDNGKYFWCEASDGKPGRDGYGDGGGGGSYYSKDYGPTFAGRGGNGVVIVRIPPYKTTVEDALKRAFADRPVTVSGSSVTLTDDIAGPIGMPDNLGAVTINLNGHAIIGADGAPGNDITPGGDGQPALRIVPHDYDCESGETVLSVTGTGSLKGGNGGKGYPGGAGAQAVSADGFTANVADGITVTAGTAGESIVQHPHQWVYTVEDGKIVATCVADGDCSYKTRKPFVAVSASDASYTALRYNKAELVNGITPVTGIVVAPEMYVGRDGTDYPESATPPTEQGAYTVKMKLDDMTISSDFIITEPKPSQGSVYEAWKTAERRGRDVRIYLSATFAGGKAINDGNVLFLGSRCNAHSMATGTVEKSINAMTKYANVRWYAYGSSDPAMNLVNQLTKKGEKVQFTENNGKITDETVHLEGGNHFVHKEMMDDLYAELVEKRNLDDGYDLLILEFDGDLLCRDGASPYELVYSLPEGWTDEKAAQLRAAISRYYAEDRVVWIVPDVNQPKSDAGYTGEYPWTSNPEFIWQRTFLNATETAGFRCPLQKNYEDADSLVAYLQDTLIGHLFSNAIIEDKLAAGLSIVKVTPEMRSTNGVWRAFDGGPTDYSIFEPRSETTVTATVEQPNDKDVTVTFDMREEQAWACAHGQVIGDDFRVVIDAALDGFFDDVAEGGERATNDGAATFTFTDSNLEEDEDDYEIVISKDSPTIKNEKLTPDYSAEDVVKTYDGNGTNIVVKPIAPTPAEAVIRYSLDEHGTYTDTLSLTEVCDKTKVWFTITDKAGEFTTVTNFACVTILPLPPEQPQEESMGIVAFPVEKFYDAEPTNITWVVTNATGAAITPDSVSLRVKGTDPWIPVADFAQYVDTTNVTVEVKAEKAGFSPVTAEATVLVKPRPVTLVAGSDTKVYDGAPLTCDDFEVKDDETTPGYGFVKEEGVASVTMTPASTVTDPGSKPNVIASETAKANTKLDRNYVVTTEPGTLTVTAAALGIAAFPVEKFYDAEPTNITWVVTNATGAAITPDSVSLRVKGTDPWIPVADFARYVDTTNVTVQVRAEKAGFAPATAEATVVVKPRPVTLVAGSDSKVYDGTPLTCDDFTVKEGTAPEYGFVKEEGVASVTMTDDSTITDPGSVPNVIVSETAKANTKLDRNYVVTTEPGTLTVTAASMGIQAFPAEKFYDAEPTNIAWVVTNAQGGVISDATVTLRVKGTDPWIPVADFALYVDVTNVTVQVRAEKSGFTAVEAEATVAVKPRPVTLVAGSDSKTYDGAPLMCDDFTVKEDTTTPGYGFVADEGIASVTMTPDSTITDPGSKPNVIASETAKEGTKLERNYTVSTEPGTLTVTAATMGIAAFPVEKFYDAEPTNVTWVVTNATGGVVSDATITLRVKGTTDWIPVADFAQYVDTTNVIVEVKAEKAGFSPVTAEAMVAIKPRPVTLVAGSDSKVYDGTPLTCDDFEVKDDDTTAAIPGYGFVNDEGVASVTMTPESTITDPGSTPNVISSETAKPGTKLDRNYVVSTEPGMLTVTAGTFEASAAPALKVYDGEPTNITVTVTGVPDGVTPVLTYSYSETEGFVSAGEFTGPTNVSESATVYCKVTVPGCGEKVVSADVTILRRYVVEQSGSAEKPFDNTPLVCGNHEEKPAEELKDALAAYEDLYGEELASSATGFVGADGFAAVPMTGDSTITDPGVVSNTIDSAAVTFTSSYDAGNYSVRYLQGELKVTDATMGIEAFPVEKFYDAEPTNISYVVTNATGAAITDATISLREKGTDPWIPAADFARYVDTTNVTVEVKAEKAGFTPATAEATVLVKPRPVTLVAGSAEKVYDGSPLTCDDFEVKEDTATEGYGFVKDEGVASVTMTPDSTITDPGTQANAIASETAKEGTKLERNYVVSTEPGTLTVTDAAMGIKAFPVEKFYDAEPTNILYVVTNAAGAVITDATISLRVKGTDPWIPAADFARYVDTTNVTVQVRAEKDGFTSVTAEATVLVKPRPVTLVAGSAEKVYDGTPLTCDTFTVKEDTATEGYGFVGDEGVASVTMTDESTITDPSTKPNVIASETAKAGTKLERNYVVTTEPGTLTVTAASMGIQAFDAEKFYDAEPTNITYVVTNAQGVAITPDRVYLRERDGEWVEAKDFVPYVDTTNVTVEVRAEKSGCDPVTAEATVLVKPRLVTLVAGSEEKTYDGTPLTCDEFEVKDDEATPGYGFVKDEGVASVTMTPESTITDPGTQPNVIASETAKLGTKLERNYTVTTEPGTLTVTAASFTASAEPVEKFYDSVPTNIIVTVTGLPDGVTPAYEYSYSETEGFVPAADFTGPTNVSESAEIWCRVIIPGTTNTVHATATIRPRIVVHHAKDGEWTYNGEEHAQPDYFEDADAEAERSKAKWGTDEVLPDSVGFVEGEGYASDLAMTEASKITDPGTKPNVIDQATDKTALKPNTKAENYELYYLDGTLAVTAAAMGIAAFPVEKFYDAEPTNISYVVTNATGAVITDATISLREKGTDPWVPAADFARYVDTTNVTVQVKAEKTGFASVTAEATVLVKPRPVTLVAGSASKTYDGTPLTCDDFTVKTDATTPGYGFVKEEGVEKVTMTDGSTITDPGSVDNVIASETAKEGTKLDRNYVVSTEPGTLTVTDASMGIAAFPVEKFYDAEATNVTWVVTNSTGAAISDATISLREKGTDPWIPAAEFPQYLNATNVMVEVKAEKTGYESATDSAVVLVKPRIVVVHAKDGEWTFDGAVHTQPEYEEDADVEDALSKAKWGTDEVLPDSVGFVEGEGYAAELIMTADSAITEPGTTNNVIDQAADKVALAANTRPENYELYYLDGLLTVWQREEEVRRDPEDQQKIEELPEETKNKIREADEKLVNDLKELEEKDAALQDEPFVKYQITVTPKEKLTERSRTTPEIAEAAVAAQEQLVPSADESVYVDITLERTTSKDEVKATDDGNYDKTKWESLDDADAHGRTEILAVTIPLDVPDGMELESVTRSCAGETDRLLPLSPGQEWTTEGFVYDSETKTVTVYAKDFCLFGFHLKAKGTPFNNLCERPLVYDFKASVRHMTLKEVKVNVRGIFNGTVYAKVRKASSLKGYLVVDRAGATSQAVVTGRGTDYNNIPASGMDYGCNRAFLVVRNASAEKAMRKPKILPAVLDAKWIARKSAADSGLAEGYLYVGGDAVAGVRPSLVGTPGALMLADYAWTSVYLFGQYNGPRWYVDGVLDQSELAINAAQPPDLQIRKGGVAVTPYPAYHDTWMNCAGFGKFFVPSTKKKACCGQANWISCGALPAEPTLSTLSGTLKGGLFLCSESGIVATGSNYETLDGGIWEDQFVTARLVPADDFAPDAFQTDLWQDGPAALETTDVLYGNWSIKIRQNGLPDTQITDQGKDSLLAAAEMDALAFGANVRASGVSAKAYPLKHHVEAATGLYVLVGTLKAAAAKLDKSATFIETSCAGGDGEIWSLRSGDCLEPPVVTPRFAQYFGLANFW